MAALLPIRFASADNADRISAFARSGTHWAVKAGNILEILAELEKDRASDHKPTLFNVKGWPLPVLDHVAVMMPFQQELYPVYEAIKAACGGQLLQTRRVDEIYGHKPISDDVCATIAQSQLVISDLTGRNPNVLYEIGIAHTLDRDVIMITQNSEDIPFGLKHWRYVHYLQNGEGLEQLKQDLGETIRAVRSQQ